ncbi:unnamed protein product, partial [Polarella glacialis]
ASLCCAALQVLRCSTDVVPVSFSLSRPFLARPGLLLGSGRSSRTVLPRSAERVDQAKTRSKKKPMRMGFNMPKVLDEPPKDFDVVPTKGKELDIMRYPHPALRRANVDITVFDDRLRQFTTNMLHTMYKVKNSCGLAAPQVGVNVRVMVYNWILAVDGPERIDLKGEFVVVNPRIIALGEKKDEEWEA